MTTMTIRLPDDKHSRLKNLAASRGISLNKLIDEATTMILTEHDAQTRFQIRASQGDVERGQFLLNKALSS